MSLTQNGKAMVLMAFSSLLASLVSLDASFLTYRHQYFHWSQVLFANGVVGFGICFLIWCFTLRSTTPLLGSPENRWWLLLRGVFGAACNASAWIAMHYLVLGDANTIMFSSPVFTGILAFIILGQQWRATDSLVTTTCLIGVVLVVRPSFIFHSSLPESKNGYWLGVAAGLGFSLSLAASSLLLNSKLRAEHTNTVTFYTFLVTLLTAWPLFIWIPPASFFSASPTIVTNLALIGVGILFTIFQFARSGAFQLSKDTTVVNMLYLEIPFAFLWQSLILKQKPQATSVCGAVIIVGGCMAVGLIKSRAEQREQRKAVESRYAHLSLAGVGQGL
jgi:drug/metabolite transporter (DMT)-like permease